MILVVVDADESSGCVVEVLRVNLSLKRITNLGLSL